ncbi:MAG: rane fusion protein multidrug efflux system [Chthoniobacter sp.]|jgi:multidrug efflux system membrane fusion protein|nr:rane fusion protein multidrug efflux system [Chthoniobacter sp.]
MTLTNFWMIKPTTFALMLALALMSGCGKQNAGPPPRPVRPVTVAKAETRDVPMYLDEIGNCTAYEAVTIQPQVTGPITEIHFQDGQDVKKGDPLFTIDPRPYQAALDKAKATLEQDRAKAVNDQVQFKRNEELRQTKVIAASEFDAAKAAAQGSQGTVQADEAAVETAQINLDYCTIKSPIEGRTSKRAVDLGNVVSPATALLLIQRQDPIKVDFTIPENALPRVREFVAAGTLTVEASFADDPSKSRVGAFDFLDSGVQPGAGVVRMRAVLENNDRMFWPGQFVNVRILLDTLKDAVLVPAEALQVGNQGLFVFIVKADNTVEMRSVKAGQRQGKENVISDGVQPGELVVVEGQLALAPGAEVAIIPAGAPAAPGAPKTAKNP